MRNYSHNDKLLIAENNNENDNFVSIIIIIIKMQFIEGSLISAQALFSVRSVFGVT